MSSLPRCSRAGIGTSHWRRSPGPSSRSDTSRPCSPLRCRTPRTRTLRQCTAPGPSSQRGTGAQSSSLLRNHGHTRTRPPHRPPDPSSHLDSGAQSSFYPPSLPHRYTRRGQSWSCRVRCSPGHSPNDLGMIESIRVYRYSKKRRRITLIIHKMKRNGNGRNAAKHIFILILCIPSKSDPSPYSHSGQNQCRKSSPHSWDGVCQRLSEGVIIQMKWNNVLLLCPF